MGTPAPAAVRPNDNSTDRRAHPRIPSSQLGVTRVHIPNRATASLVDLSAGGALLKMPFQLQPSSRFPFKLDTAGEQVEVPIQVLRCWVSSLHGGAHGGVTYLAAGAFERLVNVEAIAQRASGAGRRLLSSLERMKQGVQTMAAQTRHDAAFNELLGGTITWLRRGESIDLVALKVKAHLTQTYPSLVIVHSAAPLLDHVSSVSAFGMTFSSRHTLAMHDRRLLKAAAQLLTLLEEARLQIRDEVDHAEESPRVIDQPRPAAAEVTPSEREAAWKAIESMVSQPMRAQDAPMAAESSR